MKRLLLSLAVLCAVAMSATTAQAFEPIYGFIYKDTVEAGEGFATVQAYKTGEATCTSYFGIVGVGDCSVNSAAKNGNIRNVAYYDRETKNILGFKKVKIKVYGN